MSMPAERLADSLDLQQLLDGIVDASVDAPAVPISGITDDSRRVQDGTLFIACRGATHHGLEFAAQAIDAGAAAIAWDRSSGDATLAAGAVPFIAIDALDARLGEIANRWYDWPSHSVDVAGVTGTNGKTTVAFLIAQSLQRLGRSGAYVGTLGSGIDELEIDLGLTTPPCLDLQQKLAGFRDHGATHAAIEVSSHALDQNRLAGMRFDAAIFTNLSRDHVDYHGDMQAYGASKARLFTDFECRHRIISLDTEFGQQLADRCGGDVITTSTRFDRVANGRPYVFVRSVVATPTGSRVSLISSWGNGDVEIPLPGEFNVANVIEVMAYLFAIGVDFDDVREVVNGLGAPPGRMQPVTGAEESDLPQVFVDYAHTPAALEAALRALRPHVRGTLWCVFGCGGDRDRGKRPVMGKIVGRLADRAVVTNDNPRGEAPGSIIADILAGMDARAVAIEDRAAAIGWAIEQAGPADAVLVAGKGHEDYQLIGDERLDFSDFQTARAVVDALKGRDRDDG